MIEIATLTVLLSNDLKDLITRQIFCIETLNALYNQIIDHNKKISVPVEKENAAMHLLDFFTLAECVKNSIDANAHELRISLALTIENGSETIRITLSDDGDGINSPIHIYPYEDAFLSLSKKSNSTKNHDLLGGAGKGLAMSSQFISLFNEGSLSIGKSRHYPDHGFEVVITAPNKTVTLDWDTYKMELLKGFLAGIRSERESKLISSAMLANCERSPRSPLIENGEIQLVIAAKKLLNRTSLTAESPCLFKAVKPNNQDRSKGLHVLIPC